MNRSETIIKKFFSIIIAKAVVICFLFPAQAFSQTVIEWMPLKGQSTTNREADAKRIAQISLAHLQTRGLQRGLLGTNELAVQKIQIDELEMTHARVRQTLDGVPVWGGEAIVHLKADETLFAITDEMKEIEPVGTQPNFSEKEIIELARGFYQGSKFLTAEPEADLWIFPGENRTHLAFRVQMRREDGSNETAMPVLFIDAHTGEKIFEYDNLQTGTGASLYSGSVPVNSSSDGDDLYMEDLTRKIGTFDARNGTSTFYRITDDNDIWDSTAQRAAVDAHYGAATTYDYFRNVHGRNGIDGSGGPGTQTSAANYTLKLLSSRVHYGLAYNNAYWNGTTMVYGDGDGTTFTPIVSLDICAHEMTHGIIDRTAGLIYAGESGALSESFADVFAAMVERYAYGDNYNMWMIGEKVYTPAKPGDALRYMNDPRGDGYGRDHYSERLYPTNCLPSQFNDQCGVHGNSGIGNIAFYLLARGGQHWKGGIVPAIGPDAAAKIWYKALTTYMTSTTNFAGARTATLNAASAIYGNASAQYNAVALAWCHVGVGACQNSTPTPGAGELIVNGNFESSVSPWFGSGTGYFYSANGSYPYAGTGFIYLGQNNNMSGQYYQQVSIPATAAGALTFWLNVSTDEGYTTTQYDKLFVEVRSTAGTLLATLATYSNVNKGPAGIYAQKSLSLGAFKGQTVRLQFRSTTDYSYGTTFRIDQVSLK